MSYIESSDITDNVVKKFTLTSYITECDTAFEALAEEKGVRVTTDIETSPLHYKCKRWCITFVCMRVCEDYLGTNNVEVADLEKYAVKLEHYRKANEVLRSEVTAEMLLGAIDEISDVASSNTGLIFRSS